MAPDATFETITLTTDGAVARLTLARADAANAVNRTMAAELRAAALAVRYDPAVRAVLVSAEGKLFCGGGDLHEFAAQGRGLPAHLADVTSDLHVAIATFAEMDAPVVLAVGGAAGGAGMSLVAAADIVVAGTGAKFTMGYTAAGLVPDGGSTYFLARAVGLKRAMDLVLTNRVLDAAEAEAWGLVSRVVPADRLDEEASALAVALAAGPTASLGSAKRLVLAGASASLAEALRRESVSISDAAGTPDGQEGVAAFVARRRAEFSGRG